MITWIKLNVCLLFCICLFGCQDIEARQSNKRIINNHHLSNKKHHTSQSGSHQNDNKSNDTAITTNDIPSITEFTDECYPLRESQRGVLVIGDSHTAAEAFYSSYQNPPEIIWFPPAQRPGHSMKTGSIQHLKNLLVAKSNCSNEFCTWGGFHSIAIKNPSTYSFQIKNLSNIETPLTSCMIYQASSDETTENNQPFQVMNQFLGSVKITIPTGIKFYGGFVKTTDYGNPVTVIGMNGASTQDLLNWVKSNPTALVIANPKYLVIMIGTNDIFNRALDAQQVKSRIQDIITIAKTVSPELQIVLVSPPPLFKDVIIKINKSKYKRLEAQHSCKSLSDDSERIESIFENLSIENNLIFFNWRLNFSDKCQDFKESKYDYWKPDGVHLTPLGYQAMQKKLLEFLFQKTGDKIFMPN